MESIILASLDQKDWPKVLVFCISPSTKKNRRREALKVSLDVVTLAELKSQTAALLERIGNSSQPLLITQNGKPVEFLLSPAKYDKIQDQKSVQFMPAVNRGLKEADNGKFLTLAYGFYGSDRADSWILEPLNSGEMMQLCSASIIATISIGALYSR